MRATLTVFTPTYNRAYTLHKCYESLVRQTSKDFIWLIVDDGSCDNTKELVDKWIKEGKVNIRYKYQENQGMHGAHNTAYEMIDTEINTCIDSDDYMPDNAVELIVEFWEKNRKKKGIIGMVALDAYTNGEIIGTKFPSNVESAKYFDIYHRYKVKGDKKLIYKSSFTKLYPYPIYKNEKYVGLDYKYNMLDEKGKLLLLNEVVCNVEYMEDGSSKNMLKQYRRNPNGWCFYRVENLKMPGRPLSYQFRQCIHYVSSSLMIKNKNLIKESPKKIMTILAVPFGYVLYKYVMVNTKDLITNV